MRGLSALTKAVTLDIPTSQGQWDSEAGAQVRRESSPAAAAAHRVRQTPHLTVANTRHAAPKLPAKPSQPLQAGGGVRSQTSATRTWRRSSSAPILFRLPLYR